MPHIRLLSSALALLLLAAPAGIAGASTPCTDCPTACPCAAEGVCRPKRTTWGHYKTRWSRWPTDHGDPTETTQRDRTGLPPAIVPNKIEEDRAAPPPSDAEESPSAEVEEAPEVELPDLPPLPDLPGAGPAAQPAERADGPPELPPLPGLSPPPGIGPPPRPGARNEHPVRHKDLPPPLPTSFARLLPPVTPVQPAAHQRAVGSPSDNQVAPAVYSPELR